MGTHTSTPHEPRRPHLHNPGILALPAPRLAPFLCLWTMHVWIFWFNTTPLRHGIDIPWLIGVYGVMTVVLVAVALVWRNRSATHETGKYDMPMTACMCLCTVSVAVSSLAGHPSVAWGVGNTVAAGICMSWGYLRWATVYADLGIRDAIACLFLSYVVGSAVKVGLDYLPNLLTACAATAMPAISTWALHRIARDPYIEHDAATSSCRRRGKTLYQPGTYSSLIPIAVCVAVFCIARNLISSWSGITNASFLALVDHSVEIAFALMALVWIFVKDRSLDFPQLWRFVYLSMMTSLVCAALGGWLFSGLALCLRQTTTSLIIMLLWLLLCDVAHHCDRHPYVVVGLGWSLYVGANYLSRVITHSFEASIADPVVLAALSWAIGVAAVFLLRPNNPDVQQIFSDLHKRVNPDEYASIDERCDSFAQAYALTERETEVLKLLAKGRSKSFIAETLYISENTVRGNARRLYAKLDVHSRNELQAKLGL